jgi:hypothetical protein
MSFTFFHHGNSILSKSCREFNSRHFGPFHIEKILNIYDFENALSEKSIIRMGQLFIPCKDPIWDPIGLRKFFSIPFFSLVFHVDFEKRIHFAANSHRKMAI